MIRRKKEIKRILVVVFLISLIFLTNLQILSNLNLEENKNLENEEIETLPISSDIDDIITNTGDPQDVRIYTSNTSENTNDNQDYFEIPSLSSEDMFLTYGDFNFTFQNNYTTEYIVEDDSALYANDFIFYQYNPSTTYSGISINVGSYIGGSFSDLTDINDNTYYHIGSSSGVINFTIDAGYTGRTSTPYFFPFNRSKILGFIASLRLSAHLLDANLTIRMYDDTNSNWVTVEDAISIEGDSIIRTIENRSTNTNLNFIDSTDSVYIQFIFQRSDLGYFEIRARRFDMRAIYPLDLPITNQEYVALEFDLRGEKSTVNGFYAWIRTLDVQEANNAELNITLYKANGTIIRDSDLYPTGNNFRTIYDIRPDLSLDSLIDSFIISYNGDDLSYFSFNTDNTKDLDLYNYFIVIKSNISNPIYSLVSLPWTGFGDDRTEHQLKTTENDGNTWENAKKELISEVLFTPQLDASSFKLNVTRGYMPSDFGDDGLKIQDYSIENVVNKSKTPYLEWGIGRWNYTFPTPIDDNVDRFQIDLSWNKSIIMGFKFNVSSYSVNAYWVEGATSTYYASYNEAPKWTFEFNFIIGSPNFNDWNFNEFWIVYNDYFTANNLTKPGEIEILPDVGGETELVAGSYQKKVVVNATVANIGGIYSLNLTSFNFVSQMHSYIDYYGILWESNGFMYGDDITVSMDIQDNHHNAPNPLNGYAKVTFFDPSGNEVPLAELESWSGNIQDSLLSYDFNNDTIFSVDTSISEFGEYHLGYFWENGSAVGCNKITIYINYYDLILESCEYSNITKQNILSGKILEDNKVFDNYTILIASINETTGISQPGFYPINNSELDEQIIYEIGGNEFPILIESFMQSQDILNPNELVNIKTNISNMHEFIPIDISVNVKLVSYINEEWIIAEATSSIVSLNFSGHPDDSYEFDVDLTIPSLNIVSKEWEGVNAPVRLGGAKTLVTIYVENDIAGVFESSYYSLLSNETSNNFDGNILALRIAEETRGWSILNGFDRDECLYLPDQTSFLVNIIDRNYVSSYKQFYYQFSLNLNSKFSNIVIDPENPINGQVFNLSSVLTTEFGEILASENVSCYHYESDSWIYLDSEFTDINGSTTFLIDTKILTFEDEILLKLNWDGDSLINGVSKNVTVSLFIQSNNLSLSIRQNDVLIYKNRDTTISITLNNIGESILQILEIDIQVNDGLQYSIVEIDHITLNRFTPGESSLVIIKIGIPNIKKLNISISITAQNIITDENITVSKHEIFNVFDPPFYDYFIDYLILLIIGSFGLIWIIALLYSRRIKKKIETPIEEIAKKKPRKPEYVLVSELKKEPTKKPKKLTPIPKKVAEELEEPKEVKKKKVTDLDSLLEEKGLSDKKKKTKK
ncbi:MAG: hypothetical protein ACFE8L_05200 [Candidatus Hodarchaeota archaeon]